MRNNIRGIKWIYTPRTWKGIWPYTIIIIYVRYCRSVTEMPFKCQIITTWISCLCRKIHWKTFISWGGNKQGNSWCNINNSYICSRRSWVTVIILNSQCDFVHTIVGIGVLNSIINGEGIGSTWAWVWIWPRAIVVIDVCDRWAESEFPDEFQIITTRICRRGIKYCFIAFIDCNIYQRNNRWGHILNFYFNCDRWASSIAVCYCKCNIIYSVIPVFLINQRTIFVRITITIKIPFIARYWISIWFIRIIWRRAV